MTKEEYKNLNIGDIVLLKSEEECEKIMLNAFIPHIMGYWCGKEVTVRELYTEAVEDHECIKTEECYDDRRETGYHYYFFIECIEKVVYSYCPSEITIPTASLF